MANYDFLNLNWLEFEELARDVLQKRLRKKLETFSVGIDDGIDFRYSKTISNDIVIQCKRYSKFSNLTSALKRELDSIKELDPHRYIVVTSLSLNPSQKQKIVHLLAPFVKRNGDIITKDDLNNALSHFPEIEKKHFKLWLSSTTVLQALLHSKVFNQTVFERAQIENCVKLYVKNESFKKANRTLAKNKCLIISGMPGVGKSTLARILVYYHLANGVEEFVFVSASISEAFDHFNQSKSQVFFFDDFLGKNFRRTNLATNEEQDILRFMKMIQSSKNKLFILTTREYILEEAKVEFDDLNGETVNLSKFILDIGQYTRKVKGEILYSHLSNSKIDEAYLLELMKEKRYLRIIDHPNYNPRLIETLSSLDFVKDISPNSFYKNCINLLNNPKKLWESVYLSHITAFSRVLLANLFSLEGNVLDIELKRCLSRFSDIYSIKYDFSFNQFNFEVSLRGLGNSMILTKANGVSGEVIAFANPSVRDFLASFFLKDSTILYDILSTSDNMYQFFNLINLSGGNVRTRPGLSRKYANLSASQEIQAIDWLKSRFLSLRCPQMIMRLGGRKLDYIEYEKVTKIYLLSLELKNGDKYNLHSFIISKLEEFEFAVFDDEDFSSAIALYVQYHDQLSENCQNIILSSIVSSVGSFDQLQQLNEIVKVGKDVYNEAANADDDFLHLAYDLIEKEASNLSHGFLEDKLEDIKSLSRKLGLDTTKIESQLESEIMKFNNDEENQPDEWDQDDDDDDLEGVQRQVKENAEIELLFSRLIE